MGGGGIAIIATSSRSRSDFEIDFEIETDLEIEIWHLTWTRACQLQKEMKDRERDITKSKKELPELEKSEYELLREKNIKEREEAMKTSGWFSD